MNDDRAPWHHTMEPQPVVYYGPYPRYSFRVLDLDNAAGACNILNGMFGQIFGTLGTLDDEHEEAEP